MQNLPNALVIGPMKAGTSWIHKYLETRGDICLPRGVKETFFFDRQFDRGVEWYASHFKKTLTSPQAIVEVAPSYFHCREAPAAVGQVLGHEIPLIVTLRDPVKRAWSHYLHLRRKGYTKLPLREAINVFPEILGASRYKTCLARWESVFGGERICVLWQEELAESPDTYAKQLCEGLTIPFKLLTGASREKQNEAAMPPSSTLASLGSKGGDFLRSYRLYSVVNFTKQLGLKNVLYGKPGARALPELSQEDADWLAAQLVDEIPEWTLSRKRSKAAGCG